MRAVSFGGGVQSTAMLALIATGRLEADVLLFCNVGEDSEHPATLRYVRDVAMPYAEEHGVELVELDRRWRKGASRGELYPTLLEHVVSDRRSVVIPVYMPGGAPGTRYCTDYWKIRVVRHWLQDHGVTAAEPATVLIGFSWDEVHRVKDVRDPLARREYPLIDRRLDREACARIIVEAGLPVPPKSSCWFCPFRGARGFAEMRREEPVLFAQAVELERDIISKRSDMGRDPAYLTGTGGPLDDLPEDLPEDEGPTCDAFSCMT